MIIYYCRTIVHSTIVQQDVDVHPRNRIGVESLHYGCARALERQKGSKGSLGRSVERRQRIERVSQRVAGQSEGRRVAEGRRHLHSCTHSTTVQYLHPSAPCAHPVHRPPCHHGRSELRSELPTSTGLSSPTAPGTRAVWLSGVRRRGGAQFDRSGEGQRISTTHRASSAGMATGGVQRPPASNATPCTMIAVDSIVPHG